MVASLRSTFDRQLNKLHSEVLSLAEMVESELVDAVKALQTRDVLRAQRVSVYDKRINRFRYDIEEQAYELLALQQPFARDMRYIVTTVSVVTNLERMGDHAAGIARLVLRMKQTEPAPAIYMPAFDDMCKLAVKNLRDAVQALTMQDAVLAHAVIERDSQIDQLHNEVSRRLIQTMTDNPATIESATMLLWVSHNLERFADRINNICQRIIYLVTGQLSEPERDDIE